MSGVEFFRGEIDDFEHAAGRDYRFGESPKNAATRFIGLTKLTSSSQNWKTLPVLSRPTRDFANRKPHDHDDAERHDRRYDQRLRLNELGDLHERAEVVVVARLKALASNASRLNALTTRCAVQHFGEVGGKIGDALLRALLLVEINF